MTAATFWRRRDGAVDGRLESVQILRGVAVMIVALYHCTILFRDPLAARRAVPDALYFGYAGVDLFFVISGFIIMHVTRKPGVDVLEFVLKRVFRILPLYWLVTSLLVAVWAVKPGLIPIRGEAPWRFFLDSYLLLPTRERPLLGVGWTLQHEFQFYALVAVLLLAGLRAYAVPILILIFGTGVVLHVVIDPAVNAWDWKLFSLYSLQFALGALAYDINRQWRIGAPWMLIVIGCAGFLLTAAIVTPLMPPDLEVPVVAKGVFGLIRTIGYGLSSFLILLGALNLEPAVPPAGRKRLVLLLIWIGDASYMIYLSHNPILQGLAMITKRAPVTPVTVALIVALALVLIIVIGIALSRAVERPMIRFFEGRVMPRLVRHPVAVSIVSRTDPA